MSHYRKVGMFVQQKVHDRSCESQVTDVALLQGQAEAIRRNHWNVKKSVHSHHILLKSCLETKHTM